MDQQKEKTNSNKVKSPVKKKSNFTNHSSKEIIRRIPFVKMKKNS